MGQAVPALAASAPVAPAPKPEPAPAPAAPQFDLNTLKTMLGQA